MARQKSSRSGAGIAQPSGDIAAARSQKDDLPPVKVAPGEIAQLAPALGQYCPPAPSWTDLGASAEIIRASYDIPHRLWHEAIRVLGPAGAVILLASLTTHPEGAIASPGGWFRRSLERAGEGKLHLERALYGMRSRAANGLVPPPRLHPATTAAAPRHLRPLSDITRALARRNGYGG